MPRGQATSETVGVGGRVGIFAAAAPMTYWGNIRKSPNTLAKIALGADCHGADGHSEVDMALIAMCDLCNTTRLFLP
jgi:hypothetical protein